MTSKTIALGLALATLTACSSPEADARFGTPSADQIADASYSGVFDDAVTLVDGIYEGEPHVEGGVALDRLDLIPELTRFGDLDGDGTDEAVAFLTSNSGGTGVNLLVAVLKEQEGEAVNVATILVGDRVRVRSASVADGRVRIDVLQSGAEDAMCCPGELATREYALDASGLRGAGTEITGRLSLASVESRWTLTHFAFDEPAPDEPRVTLEIAAGGAFTGFSGCNNFNGSFTDAGLGSVEVGPMMSTRKACPPEQMQVETDFLQRLGGVNGYGFLNGRMSLTWDHEERYGVMLFEQAGLESEQQ